MSRLLHFVHIIFNTLIKSYKPYDMRSVKCTYSLRYRVPLTTVLTEFVHIALMTQMIFIPLTALSINLGDLPPSTCTPSPLHSATEFPPITSKA